MWKKIIIFIYSILLSNFIFAKKDDWKISYIEEDDLYQLIHKSGAKHILGPTMVRPIIESTEVIHNNEIVTFLADSPGTTIMIKQYKSAIFNLEKRKFIGSYPRKYEVISDVSEDFHPEQPTWKFSPTKDTVHIIEEELNINKIIKLN